MLITAEVIQDSYWGGEANRITTLSIEYPRFIHSEFMTHRVFSRNAASSRAIPIRKMMAQVNDEPAMPISWGTNQSGMQAGKPLGGLAEVKAEAAWRVCAKAAVRSAAILEGLGLHKQIVNRVMEPFQMMKTIVTATDFANFMDLRLHKDAQPEIQELARVMKVAMEGSDPMSLCKGEWHLPYVHRHCTGKELEYYLPNTKVQLSLEDAQKVSASCCAQVSYRMLDESLEKALRIYDMLVNNKPVHASPFEHQATPFMGQHEANIWSGNFNLNWQQFRKHLEGI